MGASHPADAARFRTPIGDTKRPFHGVKSQTDNRRLEGDRGQDRGDAFGGSPTVGSRPFHHIGEEGNWVCEREDIGVALMM